MRKSLNEQQKIITRAYNQQMSQMDTVKQFRVMMKKAQEINLGKQRACNSNMYI